MYSEIPKIVLGYHGCDISTFFNVLFKGDKLNPSKNKYDWLGNGIYFWENSYSRAIQWAESESERGRYSEPAVIGAVINLRNCLDLTDSKNYDILREGFKILGQICKKSGEEMPKNVKQNDDDDTIIRRNLDCRVIETIHDFNRQNNYPYFDSVRGVFSEGKPVYPNTNLRDKTHIQISIRNEDCIIGYFIPNEYKSKFHINLKEVSKYVV